MMLASISDIGALHLGFFVMLLDVNVHVVAEWQVRNDVTLDAHEVLVHPAEVVQECAWIPLVPLVA